MPKAKVSAKGQITIPVQVRRALHLEPGSEVLFLKGEDGEYIVRPRTGSIWDLRGCVPKLDHAVSIEEMNQDIADAVGESYVRSVDGRIGKRSRASDDEAA
jgi:AbrB family looped-hinge helix DNA binding protein